jgi:hypothetical protein
MHTKTILFKPTLCISLLSLPNIHSIHSRLNSCRKALSGRNEKYRVLCEKKTYCKIYFARMYRNVFFQDSIVIIASVLSPSSIKLKILNVIEELFIFLIFLCMLYLKI